MSKEYLKILVACISFLLLTRSVDACSFPGTKNVPIDSLTEVERDRIVGLSLSDANYKSVNGSLIKYEYRLGNIYLNGIMSQFLNIQNISDSTIIAAYSQNVDKFFISYDSARVGSKIFHRIGNKCVSENSVDTLGIYEINNDSYCYDKERYYTDTVLLSLNRQTINEIEIRINDEERNSGIRFCTTVYGATSIIIIILMGLGIYSIVK